MKVHTAFFLKQICPGAGFFKELVVTYMGVILSEVLYQAPKKGSIASRIEHEIIVFSDQLMALSAVCFINFHRICGILLHKGPSAPSFGRYYKQLIRRPYWFILSAHSDTAKIHIVQKVLKSKFEKEPFYRDFALNQNWFSKLVRSTTLMIGIIQ